MRFEEPFQLLDHLTIDLLGRVDGSAHAMGHGQWPTARKSPHSFVTNVHTSGDYCNADRNNCSRLLLDYCSLALVPHAPMIK